jgi:hypothetical protein
MVSQERLRAWFLIEAVPDYIPNIRKGLKDLDEANDDAIVIVRIDQVMDGKYNLVAPVDVASSDSGDSNLQKVIDLLDQLKTPGYVISHHHLSVTAHYPDIPHLAEGFISPREYDSDRDHLGKGHYEGNPYFTVLVAPGKQVHSPGFTPWG